MKEKVKGEFLLVELGSRSGILGLDSDPGFFWIHFFPDPDPDPPGSATLQLTDITPRRPHLNYVNSGMSNNT